MRILIFVSIVIAVSIWLTGCATADKTYTPDGRVGYAVECNGMVLSWGSCYGKAGDICGARGYDVISKTGNSATPCLPISRVHRVVQLFTAVC